MTTRPIIARGNVPIRLIQETEIEKERWYVFHTQTLAPALNADWEENNHGFGKIYFRELPLRFHKSDVNRMYATEESGLNLSLRRVTSRTRTKSNHAPEYVWLAGVQRLMPHPGNLCVDQDTSVVRLASSHHSGVLACDFQLSLNYPTTSLRLESVASRGGWFEVTKPYRVSFGGI